MNIEIMVRIDIFEREEEELQPQGDYFSTSLKHLLLRSNRVVVADEADTERVVVVPSRMSAASIPHPSHQNLVVRFVTAENEFHSYVVSDPGPLQRLGVVFSDGPPRNSSAILCKAVMHYDFFRNESWHIVRYYKPRILGVCGKMADSAKKGGLNVRKSWTN